MAEQKLSDRMMSDLTSSQVNQANQTLATLQPQYQQLQQRLQQLQQQRMNIAQSGIDAPGNRDLYTSVGNDINTSEAQLRSLQEQINRQQGIVNDPSQLLTAQDRDFIKGARFGESVLGDGLGRLETDAELTGIKGRLQEFAKGMSSEEMLARKEMGLQTINKENIAQQRALQARLGQLGVKGAIAGAQVRDVGVAGLQQKANLERDLMLQGREMERQGVQDLAQFTGEIKKFDLSQAAKEKDIVLQSGMGLQQMGVQERAAQAQAEAERAAAAARQSASCFPKGTMIVMKDMVKMPIELIKPMDILADGSVVLIVGKGVSDDLYDWRGITLTGTHPVYENDSWVEAQWAKDSKKVESPLIEVYNMYVEGHKLYLNGQTVGDFASLYTLGGLSAVTNNYIQKLRVKRLQFIGRMVEKLQLGCTCKKRAAILRKNNDGR